MTVDKARTLVDPHMDRAGLYVALTRGRIENAAYAITDHALGLYLAQDLRSVVEAAIRDRGHSLSDGQQSQRCLNAQQLMTDPAWPALAARLAAIKAAGEDPVKALVDAIEMHELDSAESGAQVLTWRLDRTGNPGAGDAAAMNLDGVDPANEIGRWLRERQTEIQVSQETVGQQLASESPPCLQAGIGDRTEANADDWHSAVSAIAIYRGQYSVRDRSRPVGHRPDNEGAQLFAWQQANTLIQKTAAKDSVVGGSANTPSTADLERRLRELQKRAKSIPHKPTRDDRGVVPPPERGRDDLER